ncbi:MAG: MFS transporter [Spirochaetaceae bacterium]|jgi:DHA1 family multidrug resistance protein-like MFS transporter|nr:MFS transporter [Spirochaetaceae bacterium]
MPDPSSEKSWKSSYLAILIAETLAIGGFSLSMPVIPLFLEEDIGLQDPQALKIWVGAIQSLPAVTLAVFAPIWGHLADVFSRRMMLLRAMFGGAVIVSLMYFVQSPGHLLVLRSIQGCFTGTIAAATVLTAGIVPGPQVAFALGLLQTGVAVGNSLGPLMGGLIADFLGRRAAFLSTGIALALAGGIVLKGVSEDAHPAQTEKSKKIRFLPELKPILQSPVLITLLTASFTIQAANSIAAPMLPLFLKHLALQSPDPPQYIASATGLVLGIGAAFTAIAATLAGKYAAGFGYWRTLTGCLFLGAFFTVPQMFVTNMVQLAVFRGASSFFIGGASPVLTAIIAVSTDKKHQGSVYGFNSSVSSGGGALGPLIGSAVAMLNYRAVFLAAAVLLGLAGAETFHRHRRLPSAKPG